MLKIKDFFRRVAITADSKGVLRRLLMDRRHKCAHDFFKYSKEYLEAGWVKVRVPGFPGRFEMDVRSHILKRVVSDGAYEPLAVKAVTKYLDVDRDVIDVGANIGLFTVLFSNLISNGKTVLAIEPTPTAIKHLKNNICDNGCSENVKLYEGVASNKQGESQINFVEGMEEYSSINAIGHPSAKHSTPSSVRVDASTVDDLVAQHNLNPGFMKIDVEGAEYLVLSGATKVLSECRPVILSELSDILLSSFGASSKDVVDLLKRNNYKVVDLCHPTEEISGPFNGDVIAIPIEVYPKK